MQRKIIRIDGFRINRACGNRFGEQKLLKILIEELFEENLRKNTFPSRLK